MSETGESEESLPTEYDGPTVEIGFNAQYLLDFLRASSEAQVILHFKDCPERRRIAASAVTTGGSYEYRYIVMPMRI